MDYFRNNEKKKRFNAESRWNRIEKKHIHSIHRNDAATDICRNLLKNKDFIKERQLKALIGEDTIQWRLDPNRVMDLRHFSVRKPKTDTCLDVEKQRKIVIPRNETDDREQFRRTQELNGEIEKFKQNLEKLRPKKSELFESDGIISLRKFETKTPEKKVKIVLPVVTSESEDIMKMLDSNRSIETEFNDYSKLENMASLEYDLVNGFDELLPMPEIFISHLDGENIDRNGNGNANANANAKKRDQKEHESTQTQPKTEADLKQPNKSRKISENLELVITPSFSFDIQETRSTISMESNCEDTGRESKISLDQHMSILIRNLHFGNDVNQKGAIIVNDSFTTNTATEKDIIIDGLFQKQKSNDFILLQKYFLRWVHFNTIEKLVRRNPDQTRLQKMQAFLHNITAERKKSLKKLRSNMNGKNNELPKKISITHQLESPRLMFRKFNNKIRTQQDIIELQKMKLQRQERIIADLKLSKLFDDMSEAETNLKEELKFVAKNGCQNSQSKARCLQIVGKLKDQEDEERYLNLQAKGLTAPKFLVEMQARALEREMRHQQAQQRRENLEREKEAMRIAAEEERRLQDEEAKRQRIRELKLKRKQEKELEARRALERMKYLADLEKAKSFHRYRYLKVAIDKFRNLIKWKKRNERASIEFRRRLLCRIWFTNWRTYTQRVWQKRKLKADLCYRQHCLRLGWKIWQKFYLVEHSKKLLADDWYDLHLSERMFRTWHCKMVYRRMTFEVKQKQADAHYNWHLRWKVLEHWRRLHAILQIEKQTEARRERWRSKIYELIPDYSPNTMEYLN